MTYKFKFLRRSY